MSDCDIEIEVVASRTVDLEVVQPVAIEAEVTQPTVNELEVVQPVANELEVVQLKTIEIEVRNGPQRLPGTQQRTVRIPFSHDTPSPLLVAEQLALELITDSVVCVETAFDDVAATLVLGSVGVPGLIFDTTELKPARVAQYQNEGVLTALLTTTIQLTIAPGASTTGSGFVLLTLKRV